MDIKDRIKQYTVHCDSEELAIRVLKVAHDAGLKWCNGNLFIEINDWGKYRDKTTYHFKNLSYGNIKYCLEQNIPYISAKEFLNEFEKIQFEVGKWYKADLYSTSHYIKVSKPFKAGELYGETFQLDKPRRFNVDDYWANDELFNVAKELSNLSEIQQYLPDGHVDKIQINEFKKDDYVVFTKGRFPNDTCFPINHVFKQITNSKYLESYLDMKGNVCNGWRGYRNFNKNYKNDPDYANNWRYATKTEIAKYDELCKPFDIAILEDESEFVLPEKWCIKITDENKSIIHKWKIENTDCTSKTNVNTYIYDDGTWSRTRADAPEITFEQFKTYILKEDAKTTNTDMTESELLIYAKTFYSIGTVYQKIDGGHAEVKGTLRLSVLSTGKNHISDGWGGAVYEDGKWADIISMPKASEFTTVSDSKATEAEIKLARGSDCIAEEIPDNKPEEVIKYTKKDVALGNVSLEAYIQQVKDSL